MLDELIFFYDTCTNMYFSEEKPSQDSETDEEKRKRKRSVGKCYN